MLFLFAVFLACLLVLAAGGVREQRRHFANLEAVPLRVMVNGSRGKSTVVRLCIAALRGGRLRTAGKTTGSAARMMWSDGLESPIPRKFAIANVHEHVPITAQLVAEHPAALVMECMALKPDLQALSQDKLVRAHVVVITNVREDHLDEMGPEMEHVARSLAGSIPVGGVCVTAEREWLPVIVEEADRRGARVVYADPETVSDEELAELPLITFKENVAIAIAVAGQAGISREDALRGMRHTIPDPGSLTVEDYEVDGKRITFANVFAANDPDSTAMNVEQLVEQERLSAPVHVVLNCRPDRIDRNERMAAAIGRMPAQTLFVVGRAAESALRKVPADWDGEVVDLGGDGRDPGEILSAIVERMEDGESLVGVGNIHGQGERLLEQLERHACEREEVPA